MTEDDINRYRYLYRICKNDFFRKLIVEKVEKLKVATETPKGVSDEQN